ncbi:MAG: hypothetical protein ACI4JM_09850 [Oscillospiraceae bacterium]
MTDEQILKCKSCREIFPADIKEADKLYISLMKKYHPDVSDNPKAEEISAVITSLYNRIKKSPKWKYDSFCPENFDLPYIKCYRREDGIMYYCGDSVVYRIKSDAWQNNIFKISEREYRLNAEKDVNSAILKQSISALPEITDYFKMANGDLFIKAKLENDEFPLDELLDFYGNDIDSRHCAWIISRIIGLCCFAHIGGNVLNCICTDNFMVSPSQHSLRLTGGWWFINRYGEKMNGVQSEVYENMPVSSKTDKLARYTTDLECIKAICRKIFPKNSPNPMLEYAESVCRQDIFAEFESWENVINKSFGGRYFTKMKLCSSDIYI